MEKGAPCFTSSSGGLLDGGSHGPLFSRYRMAANGLPEIEASVTFRAQQRREGVERYFGRPCSQ